MGFFIIFSNTKLEQPTSKPLLSPHSSLVSCLVRKAREENISPFQVPPSRRGSETSALETHVVAGISPRSSVTEGNTPRSATRLLSRGAPRRESHRPRDNREPPTARRPSPHRQGGKKSAPSRRPITASAGSLQPITAGERATRTNRGRSSGAGGGITLPRGSPAQSVLLPPHLTRSRPAGAEAAALCRGGAGAGRAQGGVSALLSPPRRAAARRPGPARLRDRGGFQRRTGKHRPA